MDTLGINHDPLAPEAIGLLSGLRDRVGLAGCDEVGPPRGVTVVDSEKEEVAQQCHGRHHPDIRLTVEGKDRQEKNGVGMEMEGLQPVMLEDCIEEVREGGNQASDDAAYKEGVEGALMCLSQ